MKKTLLASTITFAMAASGSALAMNAERAGQGFTDIMGDFTNASSNPALMTKYGQNDDFYTSFSVGVHAADEGEAIDEAEAVNDLINGFQDAIDANDYTAVSLSDIDDLDEHLNELNDETMFVREGVNLAIAIPNRYLSAGFFVKQHGRLGVEASYSDEDRAQIQQWKQAIASNNLDGTTFDLEDLSSEIRAAGYSVADAGFSFAREIDTSSIPLVSSLGIGTNLKYQRLDLASYVTDVNNGEFDEDDITDDENLGDNSGFNADLGIVMTLGDSKKWTIAANAQDLVTNDVELENGTTFETDTRISVGAGYQGDLFSLTAQADVTEHGELEGILDPVQYASVGAEFNLWDQAALRAGYRTDMNDVEEDIITAGIGLSPFNLVSLDVAAFTGSDSNVGGVVQVGMRF